MDWIRSLRLTTTLRLGVITLISFRMQTGMLDWVAWFTAFFVVVGASSTMALNDYIDRDHDRRKGKLFAHLKGDTYKWFVTVLWGIVILASLVLWYLDIFYGAISLSLIVIGLLYSYSRHILGLPAILVSLASSLPVLFPLAFGDNIGLWFLFFVLFFFILGREILKDMDDLHDKGYKRTIPLAIGITMAKKVVAMIFVAVLAGLFFVSRYSFLGVFAVGYSIWLLLDEADHRKVKKIMDYNTILVFILLLW